MYRARGLLLIAGVADLPHITRRLEAGRRATKPDIHVRQRQQGAG